mgnify:CR=1 FL=1
MPKGPVSRARRNARELKRTYLSLSKVSEDRDEEVSAGFGKDRFERREIGI